jgi:3-oxoadipate enol-lactonase
MKQFGRLGVSATSSFERTSAPTVMLLHGLGATASLNWFTSFAAVAADFHVVALDHRGHGRGIRAAAAFTLEDAADDVAALADALDIDRFVVAGYSMGGPIAQLVWRRHRDRVSGLVMCATACEFRATPRERMMFAALPALEQMHRVLPDTVAKRVIAQISRSYLAETGYAAWARRELLLRDPRAVLQAAIELGKYAARDLIGDIDVPTSVVIHTRDQVAAAVGRTCVGRTRRPPASSAPTTLLPSANLSASFARSSTRSTTSRSHLRRLSRCTRRADAPTNVEAGAAHSRVPTLKLRQQMGLRLAVGR